MATIRIEVPVNVDDVSVEKVFALSKKFSKHAEKLDMTIEEVGGTIALLQDSYFKSYDAVPITQTVSNAIKGSQTFVPKED